MRALIIYLKCFNVKLRLYISYKYKQNYIKYSVSFIFKIIKEIKNKIQLFIAKSLARW